MPSFSEQDIVDLFSEILGEKLLTNCLVGNCAAATVGQIVSIAGVNAEVIIDIPTGEAIAFQDDNSKKWYALPLQAGGVQSQSIIRSRRHRSNLSKKQVKTYNIKTLFINGSNNQKIILGGYIPSQEIIDIAPMFYSQGFISNLGGKKYMAVIQYDQNNLRQYLFQESLGNSLEETLVSSDIYNSNEFYLGNGLWESNAGSPQRLTIVNKNKYLNPVSYATSVLKDAYNRNLTLSKITAYADTWTPENSSSRFSFTRNVTSVTYYPQEPQQPPYDVYLYIIYPSFTLEYRDFNTTDYLKNDTFLFHYEYSNLSITNVRKEENKYLLDATYNYFVQTNIQYWVSPTIYGGQTQGEPFTDSGTVTMEILRNGTTNNYYLRPLTPIPSGKKNPLDTATDTITFLTLNQQAYEQQLSNTTLITNVDQVSSGFFGVFGYDEGEGPTFYFDSPLHTGSVDFIDTFLSYFYGWQHLYDPELFYKSQINLTPQAFYLETITPPPPPPPNVREENYVENYAGTFLIEKTSNGYIYQTINISKDIKIDKSSSYYVPQTTEELRQTLNRLTLKYGQGLNNEIVLNSDEFLIIISWFLEEQINQNSNSFTIKSYTYSSSGIINIDAINGQEFLFNPYIYFNSQYVPCLIKGTVTSVSYVQGSGYSATEITLNCSIDSIYPKKTSFLGKFIINNGSFYAYALRKESYIGFLCKSIIPIIIMNPLVSTFSLPYTGTPNRFKTDNIVDNKIYSVVEVVKTNAIVEHWDILPDGKVKFKKLTRNNYYSIGNNFNYSTLRHSFHPK